MKTKILKYNVLIKKEAQNYVAYVPTLGISDFGKTVEQAQKHVQEAISCHINGLIKTNSEVPPPDTDEYYFSQSQVTVDKNLKFAY